MPPYVIAHLHHAISPRLPRVLGVLGLPTLGAEEVFLCKADCHLGPPDAELEESWLRFDEDTQRQLSNDSLPPPDRVTVLPRDGTPAQGKVVIREWPQGRTITHYYIDSTPCVPTDIAAQIVAALEEVHPEARVVSTEVVEVHPQ